MQDGWREREQIEKNRKKEEINQFKQIDKKKERGERIDEERKKLNQRKGIYEIYHLQGCVFFSSDFSSSHNLHEIQIDFLLNM